MEDYIVLFKAGDFGRTAWTTVISALSYEDAALKVLHARKDLPRNIGTTIVAVSRVDRHPKNGQAIKTVTIEPPTGPTAHLGGDLLI